MVPALERGDMIVLQGVISTRLKLSLIHPLEELLKNASVYKHSCKVEFDGKTGVDACTSILNIGGKTLLKYR